MPITTDTTANRLFFILSTFCGNSRWEQIIYKLSRPSTRTSLRRLTGGESAPIIALTNNQHEEGKRRMKYPKYWVVFTLCNMVLAGSVATRYVIGAQDTSGQRPATAGEFFKNVQILKGLPVDQFMGTMGFFSASLAL